MKKQEYSESNIISIKLAAHTVPIISEIAREPYPYVIFGLEDREGNEKDKWRNQFPQYLIWLLNRSAKHNAIVTGKVQYIYGKGFDVVTDDLQQKLNIKAAIKKINSKESANDVAAKAIFDLELFGGLALEIIGDKGKKNWAEVYHTDFSNWRSNVDGTQFYFTKDWSKYNPEKNKDWEVVPAYDPNKSQARSILYYKTYRPQLRVYPFPEYIGTLAYIECDYEIANFHLNNLKNGFVGGTIISLNNGTPKPLPGQNQQQVEQAVKNKLTGTDNTGKIVVIFNDGKDKEPTILHMQPSDMDKQFDVLNQTVQQEIFAGHKITNPVLFGIKTPGELGGTGRQEMSDSWELFQNNYVQHKQTIVAGIFNDLYEAKGYPRCLELIRTSPVGLGLSDEQITAVMTSNEIRERAGLPPDANVEQNEILSTLNSLQPRVAETVLTSLTINEARSLAGLLPIPSGESLVGDIGKGTTDPNATPPPAPPPAPSGMVNEHIKNLSGRQLQGINRYVTKVNSGKMTSDAARMLIKSGYGLNDEDIDILLKMQPQQFEHQAFSNDNVIGVLQEFGISKNEYSSIYSTRVRFGKHQFHVEQSFVDTITLQQKILALVKKDPLISEENIAKALNIDTAKVSDLITEMVDSELLNRGTQADQNTLTVGNNIISDAPETTTITAMYDYRKRSDAKGATILPTSRDFCKKIIELDRFYSRADIEKITQRLGYSVFDYAGGFWNHGNGETTPYCRHSWYLNIVKKKRNG